MTFRTYAKIARGRIDPAPMVDIVFLLLIFLVLSSPYVLQPGIGAIKLPTWNKSTVYSLQDLVVTVRGDDLIFFENKAVTLAALRTALRNAAAQQTRPQELIIKADRQVSHGTIVQIMSMAFDAGITAVNLATRPDVSETR
jgi:biopolymer transport protein ExbD